MSISFESIRQWYLKFGQQGLGFTDRRNCAALEDDVPSTIPVSSRSKQYWDTTGESVNLARAMIQAVSYETAWIRKQEKAQWKRLREQGMSI